MESAVFHTIHVRYQRPDLDRTRKLTTGLLHYLRRGLIILITATVYNGQLADETTRMH